jgi:ornithine carbamoyltransferase
MALKDLLRTSDLTAEDLTTLLDLAASLKADPHSRRDLLRSETVAMYFSKPSTRTRLSFGTAIARLGGVPQVLGFSDLQLGRGETIEDTAHVLSRMVKAFVLRTFADDDAARFARAASIPVVNALTDGHHPCQSLADLLTIREVFGGLEGLTVAFVGDGENNVTHSLMEACALAGVAVRVGSPAGHQPSEEVQGVVARLGGDLRVTESAAEAVTGAHVVYTDTWMSMGVADALRGSRFTALAPYQVTEELMALAAPDAIFLHDLPAHRDEEVVTSVIDGPRSRIFDQAGNRLCTAQAVLVALLEGQLTGSH